MNTETINLTQVNVNAKNPRKISDPQLQRLVKSLLVFPEMLQLRPKMRRAAIWEPSRRRMC